MRKWLNPWLVSGGLVLLAFLFASAFPRLFTTWSPFHHDIWHGWNDTMPPFPPSKLHWFGTDKWGRDTYTQLIYGIWPTLRDATFLVLITLLAAFTAALVTTLYKRKAIRFVLDTLANAMTLVPPVILGILILEIPGLYFSRHSAVWYYVVIAVLESARFTRIIEGDLRLIYEKPFVEGARTTGCSSWQVFHRHMMPWLWPYLVEYVPTQYARILTVIGEFAYFGLFSNVQLTQGASGVAVDTKELDWASMIGVSSHTWFSNPNVIFFTTLSFCILVLVFRLIATGVKTARQVETAQYWPWPEPASRPKARFWRKARPLAQHR